MEAMKRLRIRFYREGQDGGDPRREDVHIGFREYYGEDGSYSTTGYAARVHPKFSALFLTAVNNFEEMVEALRFSLSVHKAQGQFDLSERIAVEKIDALLAKVKEG